MFPSERDFLVRRARYKDLLHEAEKARFVRQVRAGQEGRNHFYCWPLTWLGLRLAVWGWRLQERYDVATAACASGCQSHPLSR